MGFLLEKDCFLDWDSELLTGVLTDGKCVCECKRERECLIVKCFVWKGLLYMWSFLNSNSLTRVYFNDTTEEALTCCDMLRHILYCFYFHSSDQIYCMEFHEPFQQNLCHVQSLQSCPRCGQIPHLILLYMEHFFQKCSAPPQSNPKLKDCPWPCCINLLY